MSNEGTNLEPSNIGSKNVDASCGVDEELIIKILIHGFTYSHII